MQEVYDAIQNPWSREHKTAIEGLKTDYRNSMMRQEQTGTRLTSISPYGSFLYALTALSDTGSDSDDRFLQAARLYEQDQLIPYTQARNNAKDKNSVSPPYFAVEPTPLGQRLAATSLEMIILLGYNLVFFAAAYIAFRRYDVR
jgi:ABC-type transport system involved in multi-copper enzyme maturation permease subunit